MRPSQIWGLGVGALILLIALLPRRPGGSVMSDRLERLGLTLFAASYAVPPFVRSIDWLTYPIGGLAILVMAAGLLLRRRAAAA